LSDKQLKTVCQMYRFRKLGTLWTSATNSMGTHLDTSTKASPMSMLIRFHIHKAMLLRLL